MDVFLATQPIFDRNNHVFGYEVLYRENEQNAFKPGTDPEFASGNTLVRCFFDFGLSALTNNTRAFVNFTAEFLKNDIATLFPNDQLIVEILETVTITREVLDACRRLKKRGYFLALDDFSYQPGYDQLIALADIIKVDFRQSSEAEQAKIVRKFKRPGLRFLAEKVETKEERDRARKQGYDYFQGYFYAKPTISRTKKLSPNSQHRIRILDLLNKTEPDFRQVAGLVEADLAFSYQVLRLVNSAFYAPAKAVTSIQLAISMLGVEELRKWLYITFISGLQDNKPGELVRMSLVRGKFMEKLAEQTGHAEEKDTMMMVGMFSMLDVLLDCPMSKAIQDMHFPSEVEMTLLGMDGDTFLGRYYEIILYYGQGLWQEAMQKAQLMGITPHMLTGSYEYALKWLDTFYGI